MCLPFCKDILYLYVFFIILVVVFVLVKRRRSLFSQFRVLVAYVDENKVKPPVKIAKTQVFSKMYFFRVTSSI